MEWIKVPTNLFLSLRDNELVTYVKYQQLWGLFERQPTEDELKRYFTHKQRAMLMRWQCDIDAQVMRDLSIISKKRSHDKKYYDKHKIQSTDIKEENKNSVLRTDILTDIRSDNFPLDVPIGKTRLEESREEEIPIKDIQDTSLQILKNKENPLKKPRQPKQEKFSEDSLAVLAYINEKRLEMFPSSKGFKPTKNTLEHINARLAEGFTVEELQKVFSWYLKEGFEPAKYANFTTPFRVKAFPCNLEAATVWQAGDGKVKDLFTIMAEAEIRHQERLKQGLVKKIDEEEDFISDLPF